MPARPKLTQLNRTERERRVEHVVDLMSRGQWLAGVSDKALAAQWSCTADNARKISAEASRMLRQRLRDDPAALAEARAAILQNFEVIRAKAMANGDAQSLRVALDALRAYGFYLGIEPAKQLDIGQRHDPLEGRSTEEKLYYSQHGKWPRRAINQAAAMVAGELGNGHDDSDSGKVH